MGLLKILRKIHLTATRSCARNQHQEHSCECDQKRNTMFHYLSLFLTTANVVMFFLFYIYYVEKNMSSNIN